MQNQEKTIILNSKVKDSGGKIIFEDNILCSQFLRDYIKLPYLKDVKPEDIEDVSDQFVPLFAEERNADRVKRISIRNENPFFMVSLIEHKSKIDYNVCMQIFRYMVYIWDAYEKDAEKSHKGISKKADFKYPVILPIVYYEGSDKWTAPLDFKSRINQGDAFGKFVPDFQYYLVPLRDYSNEELLEKADEISLIMLINKLQTEKDISEFRNIPPEKLGAILQETPKHLVDIIANVLLAFLLKENVPTGEAEELVGKVKEKKMGELFENMQKIDIQEQRRLMAEERQLMEEERSQMEEERSQMEEERSQMEEERSQMEEERSQMEDERSQMEEERSQMEEERRQLEEKNCKLEEQRQKAEEQAIRLLVENCQEFTATKEETVIQLMKKLQLDEETAKSKVEQYWLR